LFFYMGILVFTYMIGDYMGAKLENQKEFISWLTWIVIYFYASSILESLKNFAPDNKVISFLNWVVNIEFVKEIKFLQKFFDQNKMNGNDDNNVGSDSEEK